jgi:RNA polymerase sigma-70 factor (ECF subfamily)
LTADGGGQAVDMQKRSDEELLRRIAAGDRSAFAAFYDRHVPRVFALVLRQLGQHGDADDVLQEVFWQVWSRARQFDAGRATPAAWLFWIARCRVLDHLRRRRRDVPLGLAPETAAGGDPVNAFADGETTQQVREALAKLPKEQQGAIRLAFFAGLTYEEVARHQAVPVGTAKTRIRLAMKKLRELLTG